MFTKDKIYPSNMDQLKDLQKKYLQISHKVCVIHGHFIS